jgi:hypothetical protein
MSSQTSEMGAQGKEKCIIISKGISKGIIISNICKELDANPGVICGC